MKKILINFFYWGSKNSGIFRAAYNLIKELSKITEEEVYILTSFPLDISSVNSLLYPKEYSKFLHFLKLQKIFYDVTKKIKPHLIFNPFHVGYFFNKKIPQICVVYDLVHITTFKKRIPSFIYHKVFLKKLIDNCRLIITPSKFTKEELISVFNINRDKIRIAHLAPDPVFKKLNLSKENFYLTLNPSFPYKNVDYIIKMWKILRVQDQLKIIGFREDFKNYINFLKKLVKKLNLEDKIIFYGEVNDETLIQLYNQAKALISASLKEGFNLPPLEALACGTP
ncbi:MAG: glycosyltransferase family 4 protein, partial [Candidatus Omnitrophica bacterium]|nr:glycosyltransferase family 4 protein [Candidatus Omnitrophota bacterium]